MAQAQQGKLLLYLIMILGLVLGYLYSTGIDPESAVPPLEPAFRTTSLQPLKGAHIDSALLTNEAFTSLRIFGSLPVQPEAGGKDNPFQ